MFKTIIHFLKKFKIYCKYYLRGSAMMKFKKRWIKESNKSVPKYFEVGFEI